AEGKDAGVVDEDVDVPAAELDGPFGQGPDATCVAQIGGHEVGLAAGGPDLGHDGFAPLGAAAGDDDVCPPLGQRPGGGAADAAAELMFAHGVARTGVEDVQKRAGVSASQLYHYFGDKRTLVRAVIARQTEAVLEAQEPLIGRLDSFEGLQAWRDVLVDLQRQRACAGGCPLGTLAAELADADPEARAELAAGFDRWEEPIRAGLRAMHERGDLRPA